MQTSDLQWPSSTSVESWEPSAIMERASISQSCCKAIQSAGLASAKQTPSPLKVLTTLLLSLNLTVAFNPSFKGPRFSVEGLMADRCSPAWAKLTPALARRDLCFSAIAFAAAGSYDSDLPPLNWGIVGLGDVTQDKAGPPFWKCSGSRLVAVMRRTPGAAVAWARRVPGDCVGYDNIDAFLLHPGLDAVYVAVRPGAHLEVARKVAEAGKHCYVEKPVGRCRRETAAMAEMFTQKGLGFYTAYISRAYARTAAVRALLANGAVGQRVTDITYTLCGTGGARGMHEAKLPWRLDAPQSGGGLVMDVGCHLIDRLDYLFGPLENASGVAENRNSPAQAVEDYVKLDARIGTSSWAAVHSEGARVMCSWNFASRDSVDRLVISGPEGSLEMTAMGASAPVLVFDSTGKLTKTLNFEAPEHVAQALIQSVTDHLRGISSSKCLSQGANAVRTSGVLDAVLASYYGGRQDEFWNRPKTWPGRPHAYT